ncbi:MerR family transcriptional regulator [Cellulomonas fimi]|uniref:Transcriptional regulator, MerR family n=1 Tax=Cellulomonas fimi (strain ATCC 484 / DSM 20113 / JCM 1341 / CCUG 24087 / LMG 16345 / NBRC 15513 / NCIMB 8980 / NCTC 7547 / NRS-133) TaxID=590998 RepID=F4H4T1_CELFA|nr:MerR family transcriptional regulator [Cellulomonas fimi]AEE44282.1 transcriptional regulator, MerR family [Cellulomonas fimi ATCC 484]NNH05729.1 MerR family transcriptional regulator [Cellulomonas fimi]VEH26038.1 Copper export regulator [Cellulomonas fimi]
MRIGELSRRTGVSTRLLRYYEEQGLIAPARSANTYREYDEAAVAQVERAVGLVRAGLPTRLAKVVLDLERTQDEDLAASCPRTVAQMLAEELAGLDARIACLTTSRTTIHDFLLRTEHAAQVLEAADRPA